MYRSATFTVLFDLVITSAALPNEPPATESPLTKPEYIAPAYPPAQATPPQLVELPAKSVCDTNLPSATAVTTNKALLTVKFPGT